MASATRESDGVMHLSCTDTAKLVRKALKAAFPTAKFSVRSSTYAGGASIDVSWTDGPTGPQVDSVIGVYAGADFDGMIDLKSYNSHWIEQDGTVHIAVAPGTEGSRGSQPERIEDPRTPGAQLVRFGADFVQSQRRLSPEVEAAIRLEIAAFVGRDCPDVNDHRATLPVATFRIDGGGVGLAHDEYGRGEYVSMLVGMIGGRRDYSQPCSCPADARYPAGGRDRCGKCGA